MSNDIKNNKINKSLGKVLESKGGLMFFLQYILPNLISIFSLVFSACLGCLTYKLNKTTKLNDTKLNQQKLDFEKLREENDVIRNQIILTALEHAYEKVNKIDLQQLKKTEIKLDNILNINNKKMQEKDSWFKLKTFLKKENKK